MLILPDSAIRTLLLNLTKQDLIHFQRRLQTSLVAFSSSEEEKQHQPSPGITTRPNGQKTLFRPFTSPSSVGCKIIVDPAPDPQTGTKDVLHGVLVICDEKGVPKGLINAEEVTSFRTALCSLIPWMWRKRTQRVVVFGAGKVAVWTVRLCLGLRGSEVESLVVVNRNKGRAEEVVGKVRGEGRGREGLEIRAIGSEEEEEVVRKCLREADAVFCTVPSEAVLFDDKAVRREEGQSKPYISAIGSWRPNMIELDPELLKRVVDEERMYNPVSPSDDGFILVDDRKSVAEHTGELLQSKLSEAQMIEVGQMLEIRESLGQSEEAAKLNAHLEEGFLIYKSVGVSVTDLASGEAILELAQKQGQNLGTVITEF